MDDAEFFPLPALFSLFNFLPLRENIDPKIWMLSGLSDRVEPILLEFDRIEDFRDSVACSEDAEENVPVRELFPNIELLFIASV
jgi:hypothetical protein